MIVNFYNISKRIASFLSDLFISINLYSLFHALGSFKYLEEIIKYQIVGIILIFMISRIFFNSLLGVSFSQYIFGLRAEGGKFWIRFGGVMRSIYQIPFLLLFPIFDFPIIFGRRSLKEVFSQTKIVPKNLKFNFLGIFIFLPLTFSLAVFSQLYEVFFTPPTQFFTRVTNLTQMELEPEVKMELEAAGLITYTSFLKNRFVIIPSFKITKLGNENKFRSQYIVYDKVLKRNLSFYFDEGPDLASYIKKFKFLNPLFKRNFPNLDKLNQNGPNILNRAESEEVEILIDNSLAFNSKNPFDYIQKNDGFINGPLLMRNEILRKYPQGKIGKIKLGDKKFLTIKENKNKNIVETFIPLYLKKGFVFKINYPQDSNFRNDFLSTFLYFSKWENPKFGGEFFLTSKEKDFKSYALERFLICAKEGISDPLYLELVMEGLDSYLFVGNLNEGIKFDKETLNKLNDQKNAIKEKSFVLKGP